MDERTMTASELARAFRAGTANPVEVLEACLAKAAHLEHVFITMTAERARAEAEASAERWQKGKPASVFDGVPVAWKDLFDVRGTVTTAGAAAFAEHAPATADAKLVELATKAGLVCVGKTNLVEFAYSGIGINPHFGTPRNPHDASVARVPGGSSSGSAVAVAAGVVPVAVGTDTAGSVRVPSGLNGLVGFKSSSRHYSQEGVFPLSRTLDSVGTLALDVEDCIALDAIFSGRTVPEIQAAAPAEQRFVVDDGVLHDERVEPAVRANLLAAVDGLRRLGASIEHRRVEAVHEVLGLIERLGWLAAPEALVLHEALMASPDAERLDPRVRKRLEQARGFPATDYVKLLWAREKLMVAIRQELDGAILILPTVAHVAPELSPLERDIDLFFKVNFATLRITMVGSFLDMPGVALPTGKDAAGLPTSFLLSAPRGDDARLLAIALGVRRAHEG